MVRKHTLYTIVIPIIIFVVSAFVSVFSHGFSYIFFGVLAVGIVSILLERKSRKELESFRTLGETLFSAQYGIKADKTELIYRSVSEYDRLQYGVSGRGVQVKFWSQRKVYKGVIDTENQTLYMREPVLFPVYAGDPIPLWKETSNMHGNGMPKKVEFYDSTEFLHRVDYLDEKGVLTKGSWRRLKDAVAYWNPKKQIWEPVP